MARPMGVVGAALLLTSIAFMVFACGSDDAGIRVSLPVDGWKDSDLYHVEDRLGETPCRLKAKPITWPERDAVQMLFERWS